MEIFEFLRLLFVSVLAGLLPEPLGHSEDVPAVPLQMSVGAFIHELPDEERSEPSGANIVQISVLYIFEIDRFCKIREHDLDLFPIIIDLQDDFTRAVAVIRVLHDIHTRFVDCNNQVRYELLGTLELPRCLLNLIPYHFQTLGI